MSPNMRINRFLSLAGVASRRKADELVRAGRVRVNGEVLTEVGVLVDLDKDQVVVDGQVIKRPTEIEVWLFHKPSGHLVSRRAQGGKPTIYDILPPAAQPLQPVGRLDFDTDGVLLLTNDGELSRRLQHPRYEIERVYHAAVTRWPDPKRVKAVHVGVDLGDRTLAKAEIRILGRRGRETIVEMTIREGRKREVKRLLDWAGAPVIKLTRFSFAGITSAHLPAGSCRRLNQTEMLSLRRLVGLIEGKPKRHESRQ